MASHKFVYHQKLHIFNEITVAYAVIVKTKILKPRQPVSP